MSSAATNSADGIIEPSRLYDFDAFCRITGIGKAGLRAARKAGMPVKYFGRKGYIYGQDVIEFILKNGKDSR